MKHGYLTAIGFLASFAMAEGSGDYTLSPSTLSTAGSSGSSADYALDASATPGGAGTSAEYTTRTGYAGQLGGTSGITLSAPALALNEGATLQLSAELLFDDGTRSMIEPSGLTWSVVSGPISGIATTGVASTAAVYQNESAIVRGDYEAFQGTLALTVMDALPDNFGSYAADALPDSWQIQYFGIGAPRAGKFDDFDGDDVSNLIEYAGGTHPASAPSGPQPLTYLGNSIVPGKPAVEFAPAPNVLPHRVVFIRRKNAANLNYIPQFSRNFATWSGATTPLVVLADDGTYQVVSHRFPLLIGGQRSSSKYFRLHLTTSPP